MKSFTFQTVSVAEVKREPDERSPAAAPDCLTRRIAANESEPLRPATQQWLDDLPAAVQPHGLARIHARIVNRICLLWDEPVRCSSYLVDLLIVRRVQRQGLPLAIANEVSDLTAYYATLHPAERE